MYKNVYRITAVFPVSRLLRFLGSKYKLPNVQLLQKYSYSKITCHISCK